MATNVNTGSQESQPFELMTSVTQLGRTDALASPPPPNVPVDRQREQRRLGDERRT